MYRFNFALLSFPCFYRFQQLSHKALRNQPTNSSCCLIINTSCYSIVHYYDIWVLFEYVWWVNFLRLFGFLKFLWMKILIPLPHPDGSPTSCKFVYVYIFNIYYSFFISRKRQEVHDFLKLFSLLLTKWFFYIFRSKWFPAKIFLCFMSFTCIIWNFDTYGFFLAMLSLKHLVMEYFWFCSSNSKFVYVVVVV